MLQQSAQDHQSAEEDAGKKFSLSYIAQIETMGSVNVDTHKTEAK